MVMLNKPAAGDTDWTTEINDNWTNLETSVNGVVRVVKTADESVTSSTALHDDNTLKFVIGANETWQFEIVAFWTAASTAPDFKAALNGPSGKNFLRAHIQSYPGSASAPFNGRVVTDYEDAEAIDIGSGPPDTLYVIKGSVSNGSTAGTFVLRWAQRASSATATVVKAGSYLVAHRI